MKPGLSRSVIMSESSLCFAIPFDSLFELYPIMIKGKQIFKWANLKNSLSLSLIIVKGDGSVHNSVLKYVYLTSKYATDKQITSSLQLNLNIIKDKIKAWEPAVIYCAKIFKEVVLKFLHHHSNFMSD